MIIEISREKAQDIKSIDNAINNLWFTVWTPERIKSAFNFGNGTHKDLDRYMKDNKDYCIFKDLTEKEIRLIFAGGSYN